MFQVAFVRLQVTSEDSRCLCGLGVAKEKVVRHPSIRTGIFRDDPEIRAKRLVEMILEFVGGVQNGIQRFCGNDNVRLRHAPLRNKKRRTLLRA